MKIANEAFGFSRAHSRLELYARGAHRGPQVCKSVRFVFHRRRRAPSSRSAVGTLSVGGGGDAKDEKSRK